MVSVNSRAEELFGYPSGALAGLHIEALVPERSRRRHRQHRSVFLEHPQSRMMGAGLELTGRRHDNSEFPVDVSLAPIVNEGERLVVAAIRDVTQQRQATAAQAELAIIVRSSFDAIISTTLEGHIVNWNPAAQKLLGYSREDILGEHIAVLIPDSASTALEELLDTASYVSGRRGAVDTRWRHQDGHEVDVAVSISPLLDTGGMIRGYSAMVSDITERKVAEHELRRLLAQEEQLQRQHAAIAEVRLALLSGTPLHDVLTLICQRASELVRCPVVIICVRDSEVRIVAAVGPASPMVGTALMAGRSFAEQVIDSREPVEIARRTDSSKIEVPSDMPDGPTLGVPVTVGGIATGSLTAVRNLGGGPFSPTDRIFAESLAAQASLAFEFERTRRDREEMALIGDRERIARDLHDHVIQRLFGAGMALQSSIALVNEPQAQTRIAKVVDQLDETIHDIRNTIFGLSQPGAARGLRAQIIGLAREAETTLGFVPTVDFDGPVDSGVPDHIVPHVLACVREGLSNAARHAQASTVAIRVVLAAATLIVTVSDNGRGTGPLTRSSGLSNLRERARMFEGTCEISPRAGGGTQLEWKVKIRP